MFKLACIAILVGSVIGTPLTSEKVATVTNDELDLGALYRLSDDVRPSFYDVTLFLDPNDSSGFNGAVQIRVTPEVQVQQIRMHALELEISSIAVHSAVISENDLYASHSLSGDDTQFLTITLNAPIPAFVPHVISINFRGQYAANMFGVYVSTYEFDSETRSLITSQLQPTYARRVFPCFDEPQMKAIFRTTIYAPPQYNTVRSNMPLRTDFLKPDVEGYAKHEFQDTLLMSSYLLAYLVSDFNYIENTADDIYNIPFRIYSRPGTQDHGQFALRFGQENMVELEKFTGFPYAFPKLDKVAVPDFAAGAMENWGLVVYREVALLYQSGVTSTSALQGIGRIITHENMHMWFGNEVSPQSWTYTWLNEGFANLFESFGTDMVHPDWRMMDQFVVNMQNVFQSDAVLTVNPMTYPVYTPLQVIGTFNAVAYQKSGSVIRMMQHFLTPDVFQEGLALYLRTNSRRAVTPVQLYEALQEVVDQSNQTLPVPLHVIMEQWTTQGGFPVVTVRRSAPAAASVVVSQERYLTDRSLSSNYRWHIPVNWVLSTNIDFEDTSPQAWVPPTFPAVAIDIPGLPAADWFIFNKQQTGYYRVNYDRNNWLALGRALNNTMDSIHVLNRAQLVDDAFNLARNGRLDYDATFELMRYLVKESDYIPWAAANAGFNYLDTVLSGTSVYFLFERLLRDLSAPLYASLGFETTPTDGHVTPFHRNIILNINCRHGNQHCVDTAEGMLQQFRESEDGYLNPDIQTTVYCSSLRGGNADNFDYLWNLYTNSHDSSQQSILLSALGCTSNSDRLDFFLLQVYAENSQVREQDRHSIVVSVINASPANRNRALDFVIDHFPEVQSNVQLLSGTTNILNAFARTLTTQEHSNKIAAFRERHADIFTAAEIASINGIQENIAASLVWSNNHYGAVDHWLRTNGSSALTASLVLLVSFIAALYNL